MEALSIKIQTDEVVFLAFHERLKETVTNE